MTYLRITKSERKTIEQMLIQEKSVHHIAKTLQRSPSTIAREIERNRTQTEARSAFNKKYADNNCRHVASCEKHHLCKDCNGTIRACRLCMRCNAVCDDFDPVFCPRRDQSPWCCNGCKQRRQCHLVKYDYRWKNANEFAELKLHQSRTGLAVTDEEISYMNALISPLLKKGQSVHHIYMTHKDAIAVSEKSIYTYIDAKLFDADVFNLPRKLGRKANRKRPGKRVDKSCHIGRSYEDFCAFCEQNPGISFVEMDTVEGPKSSRKVLLTLKWQQSGFLMAFLLERQTAAEVSAVFKTLHQAMSTKRFQQLFPAILTDRGSEFTNPQVIETYHGEKRTHLFYCDPQKPQQKPHVENEHGLLRRKFPKGTSFDALSQKDILVAISHTNSYKRASKAEKTPLEIFLFTYGEHVLEVFPVKLIEPDLVDLNPYRSIDEIS